MLDELVVQGIDAPEQPDDGEQESADIEEHERVEVEDHVFFLETPEEIPEHEPGYIPGYFMYFLACYPVFSLRQLFFLIPMSVASILAGS